MLTARLHRVALPQPTIVVTNELCGVDALIAKDGNSKSAHCCEGKGWVFWGWVC
jgi:hypothetical protein